MSSSVGSCEWMSGCSSSSHCASSASPSFSGVRAAVPKKQFILPTSTVFSASSFSLLCGVKSSLGTRPKARPTSWARLTIVWTSPPPRLKIWFRLSTKSGALDSASTTSFT